jgi:hypothetical protein
MAAPAKQGSRTPKEALLPAKNARPGLWIQLYRGGGNRPDALSTAGANALQAAESNGYS